ncbi:MAG TPA: HK97 gp10 family phage protein, partial [Burkholderiaceae bacterium]|nr:HK97 gp10 family phage protein [Burkholderiaceae bacterium]
VTALAALAPELRRGPARRALRAGAELVLTRAIAETPQLSHDIYRKGVLVRRKGTLRRALAIRNSKDTNRTGDVGVFVNIRPLQKGAVATFKATTGRRSADNPDDPYYWRWVHFATKRNHHPVPFLTRAAEAVLATASLSAITESLTRYFQRLNQRGK